MSDPQALAPEQAPERPAAPAASPEVAAPGASGLLRRPLLVDALAATDDERRADTVNELQRRVGNRAVARWLATGSGGPPRLQRGVKIAGLRIGVDPDLTVEQVIAQNDADLIDNLDPAKLTGAKQDQKITLLSMLAHQGWAGSEDEGLMLTLWGSFGDIAAVASENIGLWKLCIEKDAPLRSLEVVTSARTAFEEDVKETTRGYLKKNREYVLKEMAKYGIAEGNAAPAAMTEQQQNAAKELQGLAQEIARASKERAELCDLPVGYDLAPEYRPGLIGSLDSPDPQKYAEDVVARRGRGALMVTTFDPFRPPHHRSFGDETPAHAPYAQVKGYDDELARYIGGFSAAYPAVYALIRDGKLGDVAAPDRSPDQIRQTLTTVLQGTLNKIDETVPKVGGALDWKDLKPVHEQLLAGSAHGTKQWDKAFYGWVVDDMLKAHASKQFWLDLGLATLAAAAFVVAEIATFGTATFFIAAGIGLGITATQAAFAWDHYDTLNTAAGTTMSKESEIITQGQASAAMVKAAVDTVMAFIAMFAIGAKGAKALAGAGTAAAGAENAAMTLARSKMAQRIAYMERRIAMALERKGARDAVVDSAKAEIEAVHQGALKDAATIRNGKMAEFSGLNEAERNNLANEYLEKVGDQYRQAQGKLGAAADMVPQPVNAPGAGTGGGPSGVGPPPKRPPSLRAGEGWENW